jgi:ribosomal protein L21E
MVETRSPEEARRDERTLMERLIRRQGLSPDEAMTTVVNYRQGKRVEIDPALMEGLDAI